MEPITTAMAAFAAVQKSVALIKAATAAGKDVASLGALIGGYFEAKHTAVKAVTEAKKSGGSNLGKAVQIELQLKEQADFEQRLKDLFFPHNMDVWQNIQKRVAEMNAADKAEMKRAVEEDRRRRIRAQHRRDTAIVVLALSILFTLVGLGVLQLKEYCEQAQCGHR